MNIQKVKSLVPVKSRSWCWHMPRKTVGVSNCDYLGEFRDIYTLWGNFFESQLASSAIFLTHRFFAWAGASEKRTNNIT